ncbi:hypothetical protein AMJ80_05090 [bacterium SM23_31]|nr:MAG: hypothetical protein AMJ80_05090 [bacterium SM23_31]
MPQKRSKNTFFRLLSHLEPYKIRIIGGALCTVFMGLSDVILAPVIGKLIDGFSQISRSLSSGEGVNAVINGVSMNRFGMDYELIPPYTINGYAGAQTALWILGTFVVFLMIFKGIFVYAKEYLMSSVIQKTVKNLRDKLYAHLLQLKMQFFEHGKTGEIMSRVTNDVQIVEQSLGSFVVLTQALVYAVIYITALLITDWKLTLFAMIVFPVSGVILKLFADAIRKASRKIMAKIADINAFLQESITAIKVIKTYNREDYEIERFAKKTYQNYSYSMRANRLVAFLKPSNEFLSTVGMMAVILFCGFRILNQRMDIEVFTIFAILISMAYKPLKTLGETQPVIQRALASSERIFELLDRKPEKTVKLSKDFFEKVKGAVEFKDVKFSYNGKDLVLNGITLSVAAGETVALVGPSGVGKSTIINLLLKFYECQSGTISIDRENITTLDYHFLRDQMSLVPQETILFSGTVRDNISYGRLNASQPEIEAAAKAANAHDFIMELPNKYDTEIGERGVQLSGGQRQRIAIARAILKNPPILLLDEATSALDSESEKQVQDATFNLMKDRTTFVIAHRLSTVKNVDKIAVMDTGKIVQLGTHEELIQQDGLYKSLYELQFK